jgi:mRNA interferase RelE/StbE
MKTVFKSSFLKAVKKIRNEQIKSEIADVIENVEKATGIRNIANIKKLKGFKDCYRIRIANYRIGLKIIDNIVFFVDIDNRKDIYKHFP